MSQINQLTAASQPLQNSDMSSYFSNNPFDDDSGSQPPSITLVNQQQNEILLNGANVPLVSDEKTTLFKQLDTPASYSLSNTTQQPTTSSMPLSSTTTDIKAPLRNDILQPNSTPQQFPTPQNQPQRLFALGKDFSSPSPTPPAINSNLLPPRNSSFNGPFVPSGSPNMLMPHSSSMPGSHSGSQQTSRSHTPSSITLPNLDNVEGQFLNQSLTHGQNQGHVNNVANKNNDLSTTNQQHHLPSPSKQQHQHPSPQHHQQQQQQQQPDETFQQQIKQKQQTNLFSQQQQLPLLQQQQQQQQPTFPLLPQQQPQQQQPLQHQMQHNSPSKPPLPFQQQQQQQQLNRSFFPLPQQQQTQQSTPLQQLPPQPAPFQQLPQQPTPLQQQQQKTQFPLPPSQQRTFLHQQEQQLQQQQQPFLPPPPQQPQQQSLPTPPQQKSFYQQQQQVPPHPPTYLPPPPTIGQPYNPPGPGVQPQQPLPPIQLQQQFSSQAQQRPWQQQQSLPPQLPVQQPLPLPVQQTLPQLPLQQQQPQLPPTIQQLPLQQQQPPPPLLSWQPQQQPQLQQQQQQQQHQAWQHQLQQQQQQQQQQIKSLHNNFGSMGLNQTQSPNVKVYNLLQERSLIPKEGFQVNEPVLHDNVKRVNCHPDIMSCTLNAIPNCNSLLQKTRLPLGLIVHPFKDLSNLQVIQSSTIVRCRVCRTYINPFVVFVDPARWKCNVCFKINELPSDFCYDSTTNMYVEPHKRPEVKSATVEYVASAEYMLRPPQPAVYLYLLDVSFNAVETGYLKEFCDVLKDRLDKIPGDSRKQIGFVAYDTALYFFNLSDELNQPQVLCVPDIDEVEIPCPDGLLVNMEDSKQVVLDLLDKLPTMFTTSNTNIGSCLGSALEAAYKMMTPTGGRVTVMQTQLPSLGPGALKNREDANERVSKNVLGMGPVTDFYKKLALECSALQISIDLFFLNSQFADIATVSGAAKHTSGCSFYFPGFHASSNLVELKRFRSALSRYLTRKIGFEAVMRIRCTKGLNIHTFHGNCFVRSTDLLSLPNVSPDVSFGMQMSIDDVLDANYVYFQAALLYTSSRAERRIRVHTLCIPVSSVLSDIQAAANQRSIISLISKMAVDKSLTTGLGDSREALVNAALDIIQAYRASIPQAQRVPNQVVAPESLKLIPLLVLALLKFTAFRIGLPTKIDDRVVAMEICKWLPLNLLLLHVHPSLYPLHNLTDEQLNSKTEDDHVTPPPVTSLSSHQIDRHGAYIMDAGSYLYLFLGSAISDTFCANLLDVASFGCTVEGLLDLPDLDNKLSTYVRCLVHQLNSGRPVEAPLILIREDGKNRYLFNQHLVEDRSESSFSYLEFIQHLLKEIKI